RIQRRRRYAGADRAEIENLQPGVTADVQEAVVEGHPACGFATTQRADEILASRSLNVADVGDVVGGQRLASKDEYQIAEPERAVRRIEERRRRVRIRRRYQPKRTISLEVTGQNRWNREK